MANSVVFPRAQFFSNSGRPLVGGRIHTYVAGSSTRARTYQDAANVQINTNPIILDARGEAAIYLAEGVEYKFVVEDSTGALIMTQEPVYGAIWPNASEWPSDTTLSYQYMTEARAAASATGPIKFFDTKAQADAAIGTMANGDIIEVSQDETRAGARTRYKVQAGALVFVVNLDQTRLDLAASTGASLVGHDATLNYVVGTLGAAVNAVCINVMMFPWLAKGNGIDDDYTAIIAAQTWVNSVGGGTLIFPSGKTFNITQAIPMIPGVTYQGGGRSSIDNVTKPGSKIISAVSSIFCNTTEIITGVTFDGLWLESSVGGGHIFDWSNSGIVAKIEVKNSILVQNNPARAVVQGTASGGVFSIWMNNFEYKYATGNTVPALNFVSTTINGVVIEKFWSTGSDVSGGTYSIWIESINAAAAAFGNKVIQGTFEIPGGGSVNMLSCYHSYIDQCIVYDLSVVPSNPAFRIAKGAIGPSSSNCSVTGSRSKFGTALSPDLQIDMSTAGAGNFVVGESSFLWFDGVSPNTNGISIRGNVADNYENISYLALGESPTEDIQWKSTGAGTRNYSMWNGDPGNLPGHLVTYQNGVYVGSISPSAAWQWGGSAVSPNFYVLQNGQLFTKGKIFPATDALADQGVCGIFAGNGIPANANGADGDIYFRGDGGAGTTIYQRRVGAWVGIV